MELELYRVEYCSVGTTLPNSMKLLPTTYKEQQKVAVGDQDGVLQVFSIKKDEPQVHFKTLPSEKIQSVQLGGATGTIPDRIFTASENKVRGFNKKGKIFLSFDTNLTEPIKSMFVNGNDLIACGNHVYNHYRDCKDIGSYLCGDTIVDAIALCPNNTNRIITALACSGRVIRFLEHCRVRQSIELESVPTILHVPYGSGDRLVCGMADGRVVLLKIGHFANSVQEEVLINNLDNTNAVTAIDTYDLTGDGKIELIIGRRDGTVQVFSLPSEDNVYDVEIRQIYNENFNESISSIQGGCVGTNGYTEIVVCTYAGRIFGLTTQCIKLSLSDSTGRLPTVDSAARIEKLKEEIRELETKVQKERDRYKASTQTMSTGLSAIPMLDVNDSMDLSKEDASYTLSLEIAAPIEFVLLQCDVPIELMDIEKNTAVVSLSKTDPMAGNHLLATYRCQIDKNRVDLKFRTAEGHHGTLQVFITPNIQPKVSQLQQYPIKPLSLHMRIHTFDEKRPTNTLTLKGSFSHAEIHNWIMMCVPEVPEKLQIVTGEKSVLYFKNVFIGSILMCVYCKGEADFKTDNITTLSIIKDFLTKEATKRRIKLEISNHINHLTLSYLIKQVEPRLIVQLKNRNDHALLMTLIDLDIQNEDEATILDPNYKDILERRNEIIEAYKTNPAALDRLIGFITDAYIDFSKLRGLNAKLKIPELIKILNDYNFEQLIKFLTGESPRD